MPFLVSLDRAARSMVAGIESRAAVVAFPWQLATIVRAGILLPAGIYDRIVRRARRDRPHLPAAEKEP